MQAVQAEEDDLPLATLNILPCLTVNQASKLYQVRRSHLDKWVREGKLARVEAEGVSRRFLRTTLDEFFKSLETNTPMPS